MSKYLTIFTAFGTCDFVRVSITVIFFLKKKKSSPDVVNDNHCMTPRVHISVQWPIKFKVYNS